MKHRVFLLIACFLFCTGAIVAQGTPEEVAEVKKSYTGQYLRPYLGLNGGKIKGKQSG